MSPEQSPATVSSEDASEEPDEPAGTTGEQPAEAPSTPADNSGLESQADDAGAHETTEARGSLRPREDQAYTSYQFAASEIGATTAIDAPETLDKQAYKWLREHGPDEYNLPDFNTWQRYVRAGRAYHDTRKHNRRHGRTSQSIAKPGDTLTRH